MTIDWPQEEDILGRSLLDVVILVWQRLRTRHEMVIKQWIELWIVLLILIAGVILNFQGIGIFLCVTSGDIEILKDLWRLLRCLPV